MLCSHSSTHSSHGTGQAGRLDQGRDAGVAGRGRTSAGAPRVSLEEAARGGEHHPAWAAAPRMRTCRRGPRSRWTKRSVLTTKTRMSKPSPSTCPTRSRPLSSRSTPTLVSELAHRPFSSPPPLAWLRSFASRPAQQKVQLKKLPKEALARCRVHATDGQCLLQHSRGDGVAGLARAAQNNA